MDTVDTPANEAWYRTMSDVIELSDKELDNQSFRSLNLKVTLGLPGAENLSVLSHFQTLNTPGLSTSEPLPMIWPTYSSVRLRLRRLARPLSHVSAYDLPAGASGLPV